MPPLLSALLFGQIPQPHPHIGCIEVDCNPRRVVVDAYENARFLCDQYCKTLWMLKDRLWIQFIQLKDLGAPEMEIIEHNGMLSSLSNLNIGSISIVFSEFEKNQPIRTVYVPSHLYHILFELFKNSMRAVMEKHQDSDSIPPLKVVIVKGKEDICLKISGDMSYIFWSCVSE